MTDLNTLLNDNPSLLNKLQAIGILDELNQLFCQTIQDKNTDWEQEFTEIIAKGQIATASLRAPEGYHLPETMQKFADKFTKFGGHPGAAGFSAQDNNLPSIKKGFEQNLVAKSSKSVPVTYVDELILASLPTRMANSCKAKNIIWIDNHEQITENFLQQILALDPFGQDFPMPDLALKLDAQSARNYRFIGSDGNHLKLTLPSGLNITLFNIEASELEKLGLYFKETNDAPLYLIGRVSQNTWNNQTKLELIASLIEVGA